jgi:energy-coupling factor transporter transmembrane protein EcfT
MSKLKILKLLLVVAASYYFIGAIVHFFGLTVFPFYDGALYQPYHDTVISLAALAFSLLLFFIAKDPIKNIDSLNVMIIGGIIAIIFSIGIIFKIDFVQLGAPGKKLQTIVEMVLLITYIGSLIYLKPKK